MNQQKFVLVTDKRRINPFIRKQRLLTSDEQQELFQFRIGAKEIDFKSEQYRLTSFDQLYSYSVARLIDIEYDETSVVRSFDVLWHPTWVESSSTVDMPDLNAAYWTYVTSKSDHILDVCPYNNEYRDTVRRILDHKIVWNNDHNCIEPIYLIQWAIEHVTLESYENPNYVKYARLIREYILRNDMKEFSSISRRRWFGGNNPTD